MYKKRKRMSRRSSKKVFRKGTAVNYRNVHSHPMRGGIRF
jgi:hypothetical protein